MNSESATEAGALLKEFVIDSLNGRIAFPKRLLPGKPSLYARRNKTFIFPELKSQVSRGNKKKGLRDEIPGVDLK